NMLSSFFFQAEDGIRDFHVTGVQTCALPILRLLSNVIAFFQSNNVFTTEKHPHLNAKVDEDKPWERLERVLVTLYGTTLEQQNRSEERRVGKECRDRRRREC